MTVSKQVYSFAVLLSADVIEILVAKEGRAILEVGFSINRSSCKCHQRNLSVASMEDLLPVPC